MDFDKTYERLQDKGELSASEEKVLLVSFPSKVDVKATRWKVLLRRSKRIRLKEMDRALEELKRLALMKMSEPGMWKLTELGEVVKQIKESEDKKLCEISKGDISKEAL